MKDDSLISRNAAIDAVAEGLKRVFVENQDIAEKMIGSLPPTDAVPVTWIEGEIKWLKEMDNPFATMSAGQIEAMLKRWKDGDGNDTV